MGQLTIGFIGADRISELYAERLVEIGGCLAAVADTDPTLRHTFADRYDVGTTFKRYEEMFASQHLDVVVVDTAISQHAEAAVAALEAGSNVLIQAPLAHNLDAAKRIARAEANAEATLMIGLPLTFETSLRTLKSYLEDERLGEVHEVNVELIQQRGDSKADHWFTDQDITDGDAVTSVGSQALHLAMYLLDFPKIETITASTGAQADVETDQRKTAVAGRGNPTENNIFDAENTMRTFVRTVDGTTVHVNCAWVSNTEPRQFVELFGDDGGATLTFDDGLVVHTTAYSEQADHYIETDDADPHILIWEYLLDVVRGKRDHVHNTVAQGVAVQRIVDAIYRSSKEGQEVELTGSDSDDIEHADGHARVSVDEGSKKTDR